MPQANPLEPSLQQGGGKAMSLFWRFRIFVWLERLINSLAFRASRIVSGPEPGTPAWKRSRRAYRKFQKEQRSVWLRLTFEELLYDEGFWTGETDLEFPCRPEFRRFEAAGSAGDLQTAQNAGRYILATLREPTRGAARILLAARAVYAHDNLPLADWLLREQRKPNEDSAQLLQLERVFLLMRHTAAQEFTSKTLEDVIRNPRTKVPAFAKDWIHYRWLYDGPSAALLSNALKIANEFRTARVTMHEEGLALAFLLKDFSTVEDLLRAHPEMAESYDQVLPLADYLFREGRVSVVKEPGRLAEYAGLYRRLVDDSAFLMELLADKSRTLAIVGNSSCEMGRGKGTLIDSHDFVARFNHFSLDEGFASDYGKKCDIHVRRAERPEDNERSLACKKAVINRPDLF
jgi:hypothetical protein